MVSNVGTKALYLPESKCEYSDVIALGNLSLLEMTNIAIGRLLRKIPLLYIDSPERLFIEKQLLSRNCDVSELWCHYIKSDVSNVLLLIQDCFFWPNSLFMPDDRLKYVFLESDFYPFGFDDFCNSYVFHSEFKIDDYDPDEKLSDFINRIAPVQALTASLKMQVETPKAESDE